MWSDEAGLLELRDRVGQRLHITDLSKRLGPGEDGGGGTPGPSKSLEAMRLILRIASRVAALT